MAKVLVGMSGGVDSSAAAKLLIDMGHKVTGATIKMFDKGAIPAFSGKCGDSEADDAAAVCRTLGIEHLRLDFSDRFAKYVMDSFVKSYLDGETPNPCIECNAHLKFGAMLEYALDNGFDMIATGHYAERVFDDKTGKYLLMRPSDRSKDQTYVLYKLTQHQLEHTIFPLWGYEKPDIRKIAASAGLINADKPDSQDICFVPDGDYASFIVNRSGVSPKAGDMLCDGAVIAQHRGIIHYTIGQRKGLGIALGKPAYVVDKNAQKNTVTIGGEDLLFKSRLVLRDVNWVSGEAPEKPVEVTAKTRYSQSESKAVVYPKGNGAEIVFEQPQRAPAKGQAAVFYDGDILLGGGTIDSITEDIL